MLSTLLIIEKQLLYKHVCKGPYIQRKATEFTYNKSEKEKCVLNNSAMK